MKRKINCSILFFSLFITSLTAANFVSHGGELFESALDSRSAAMAGVAVSSATGPAAIFSNPALMIDNYSNSITFSHRKLFGGLATSQLVAFPIKKIKRGYLSFGLINRNVADIPDTRKAFLFEDSGGPHLDYSQITYFSQNETGFILSYAGIFKDKHKIGINLKPIFISIDSYHAWGFSLDAGYFYSPNPETGFGLFVQDATSMVLAWSTGTNEIIPPRVVVGGHRLFHNFLTAISLSTRLGESSPTNGLNLPGQTIEYNLGIEGRINDNLSLQCGVASLNAFTAGFNLKKKYLEIRYAYLAPPAGTSLGGSHEFGFLIHIDQLNDLDGLFEP